MLVPTVITGRCLFRPSTPGGWSSRARMPSCTRTVVRAVLRCVVSKRLQALFRDGSSRLRGIAAGRRERRLLSVPTVMSGRRAFPVLLQGMPILTILLFVCSSDRVVTAYHCVVSKRLQALFRDSSSRLRGAGIACPERWSILVRMAIVGCLPFPDPLLFVCFTMGRLCTSGP